MLADTPLRLLCAPVFAVLVATTILLVVPDPTAAQPPDAAWPAGAVGTPPPAPRSAASDTLRAEAVAAQPFILALPDSLSDAPVERYAVQRAPTLSWLVDRSFLWHPQPSDTGSHTFHFEAAQADTTRTLVLLVTLQP